VDEVKRMGQKGLMISFHKFESTFLQSRPLKELILHCIKGPYVSEAMVNGSTETAHTNAVSTASTPQVQEQYIARAKPRQTPPAVHPTVRDAALANLRKKQQESVDRIAAKLGDI